MSKLSCAIRILVLLAPALALRTNIKAQDINSPYTDVNDASDHQTIPGYSRKATFAVARHGNKAWMGGLDFLDPTLDYFSSEKAALLKSDDPHDWIGMLSRGKVEGKTPEEQKSAAGDAIGKAFGSLGPSKLTATGEACEREVGEFYKVNFAIGEFYKGWRSSSEAYVYSDNDQRDTRSGELFLEGMGVTSPKVDSSMPKMLAEMVPAKTFTGCPCATPNEIMKASKKFKGWEGSPVSGLSIEQINQVWKKNSFAKELSYITSKTGTRRPYEDRDEYWMTGYDEPLKAWGTLDGGLRAACMLTQVWEAEVASNVDTDKTMYHKLGVQPSRIPELMRVCWGLWSIHMNSVNRARNVELPIQLLASMKQAVSGERSSLEAVKHSPLAQVLMYEGHNYNLDLLRQVLGVQWSLGQAGWGCDGVEGERCVLNAQPYHARLNIEIFTKTGTDQHFVRLSVFQVTLDQTKESCAGGLGTDKNLHVLSMSKDFCPSFEEATSLCPWEEFSELLRNFIYTTQETDGEFCAEKSTGAWFKKQQENDNGAVGLEERDRKTVLQAAEPRLRHHDRSDDHDALHGLSSGTPE